MDPILDKSKLSSAEVAEYSNTIKGVEIFSTGTWNGDEYTEQDLDDMIKAFEELDYRPALKVGHTKDKPGSPSYGWIANLRKVGGKLVADFEDLHDSVVDALRKRTYDRVSSEVYFNLKRGEKTFRRALKAVALLGAEVPAVAGLKPIGEMQFSETGFDKVVTASEGTLSISNEAFIEALSQRVDGLVNLIKEYDMAKNADAIKALKAQFDEFKMKMDKMKKDGKKEEDAEYKQLADQANEISQKVAALEAADKAEADAEQRRVEMEKQLSEAQAAAKKATEEAAALAQRVATLEQDKRSGVIGTKVQACKLPAFRPGLEALYAYAVENTGTKVKVFSKKDGKDVQEEKSMLDILDGFVAATNDISERLFKALAVSGQTMRENGEIDESAAVILDKRTKEYQAKHPEVKSYEVAMRTVLASDPELAKKYREQFTGSDQ